MCTFIWPTNGIYKVFWHYKMNFIKVFKCYWSGNISIVLGGWFCFIFSKLILGVFWACCFLLWFLKKNWGVFRACSGLCCFLLWFLKNTGACSGRVLGVLFLLNFFTKILGRVLGVFSVFQCVQCVVSTDPKKHGIH